MPKNIYVYIYKVSVYLSECFICICMYLHLDFVCIYIFLINVSVLFKSDNINNNIKYI